MRETKHRTDHEEIMLKWVTLPTLHTHHPAHPTYPSPCPPYIPITLPTLHTHHPAHPPYPSPCPPSIPITLPMHSTQKTYHMQTKIQKTLIFGAILDTGLGYMVTPHTCLFFQVTMAMASSQDTRYKCVAASQRVADLPIKADFNLSIPELIRICFKI